MMEKMKAIVCTKYGPPEVLKMMVVDKPIPKNNEVLIKIVATSVTASDCIIRGFKLPVSMWIPGRLELG
jgi:NADPH:quinone reductase-like Zn-dependent oxidoreductase